MRVSEGREPKGREPKRREPKKRGSKLLRCGAQTPSRGLRRDKIGKCVLIFFDEGRNWASAPQSVGVYSHDFVAHVFWPTRLAHAFVAHAFVAHA